jgi:hypothetical protein
MQNKKISCHFFPIKYIGVRLVNVIYSVSKDCVIRECAFAGFIIYLMKANARITNIMNRSKMRRIQKKTCPIYPVLNHGIYN